MCKPCMHSTCSVYQLAAVPVKQIAMAAPFNTTGRPKLAYFGKILHNDEEADLSICKARNSSGVECGKGIKGKNPTNLKQHLSKYHPDNYKQFLEK